MRLLILSDIHSNLEALRACLDAAPEFDHAVNLGDIVGYGASPNEVTQICREMTWLAVRGNHDKVCTGLESAESFNPIAAMAAMWTRQVLIPDNLQWLRALPEGPLRQPELSDCQFVHGSPLDEDQYMVSMPDATEVLSVTEVPVTFFGHSHIQGAFYVNTEEGPWELRPGARTENKHEKHTIYLTGDSRYLINPGSIGQPRDGDWRAAFAIYDSDQHTVNFHRVPYEVKTTQQRIRDAHLPERLAIRLGEGR